MLINSGADLFDFLRGVWKRPAVARGLALALVGIFLGSSLCILCNNLGLLPSWLALHVPLSPFRAIQLAFALVLGMEVVELIFAVADSVSRAVGKQLEIMALILLREAFKDISLLHGPLSLAEDGAVLLQITASITAALLLLIFLGIYVRLHRLQGYIKDPVDLRRYIGSKKCVSLLLFLVFAGTACYDAYTMFFLGKPSVFFQVFYTALIFSDILLVLVGQYFMPSFHATFRNSGYAAGTLLMRIALGAPHYAGAALCVFAGLFVLALTWATARFMPEVRLPKNHHPTEQEAAQAPVRPEELAPPGA